MRALSKTTIDDAEKLKYGNIKNGKMENVTIELCKGGKMPERAHESDAAYDVFASEDTELLPGKRLIVPLGFRMSMSSAMCALIQPRSGCSSKGLPVYLCKKDGSEVPMRYNADVEIGLIDSGYRGVVGAIVKVDHGQSLRFTPGEKVLIKAGTRIAQMRFAHVPPVTVVQDKVDRDTSRGEGGFNSTGTR